jgi:peptide-methionine (R)-S-oxide reductase
MSVTRGNIRKRGILGLLRRREGIAREVEKSDQEWRAELTDEQFRVLRGHGTERPFSGTLLPPDERGMYRCAGCGTGLFRADTKFESGSGWPSFTDSEPEVETRRDLSMGIPRTEVLCRRCGGHLGHVFNDGPRPTGKRYCINACAIGRAGEPHGVK